MKDHFLFGKIGKGLVFQVKIKVRTPIACITNWKLLRGKDGYIPNREPAHTGKALTWVLETMHLYAFDLGLAREKRGIEKNKNRFFSKRLYILFFGEQ
jgi:hypothetical protein